MIWSDEPANESVKLNRIYRILNEGMSAAPVLLDEVERLREMLRTVEYSTYDDVLMVFHCAWCDATRREGHRDNCEWKAALEAKL